MILKCIKKHFFGISTQNFVKSRANWVKRIAESDSAKKGLSEKYIFAFALIFLLPSVIKIIIFYKKLEFGLFDYFTLI